MPRISENLLQEILLKTNYIGMYQEKVRLTKKGSKWWGLCPFHSEKTPSFTVDSERGLFYCFGCQKGGSLIDFLMETEKLSFIETVEELAEKASIKLPDLELTFDAGEDKDRNDIYNLNEKLATTFNWLLLNHNSGKNALSILEKRQIPIDYIRSFRLGYAPPDTTWLYRFLESKGYTGEFLLKTGLFSSKSKKYPLFSDRIMFPISDQRGRVLAFGGRLLSGDGPKYINSPDTLVFKKQENLFGIDKALAAIKKQNMALVCEGYMDVISFHIAGMDFAVAPLGTAFTSRQAQLLRRRSEKVILCFDSDSAGQKAAERACVIAVTAGLQADVIIPPNGKDASEILEKSGVEALKNILEYSINSGEFLIRRAEELFDLGTLDGKSRASSFFYPYLDALESEVKRNSFLEVLGRRMGINPTALLADYQKAKTGIGYRVAAGGTFSPAQSSKTALIARTVDLVCMSAILLSPGSFSKLSGKLDIEDFDDPRARDIYAILEESLRAGVVDTSALLPLLSDDTLRRFIISMAASGELDENLDAVINDGIKRIRMRSLERKRIRLTLEIGRASQNASMESENKERLVELLTQKMSLDNEISLIKGDLDE